MLKHKLVDDARRVAIWMMGVAETNKYGFVRRYNAARGRERVHKWK
jgi:hypothetical protein